MFFFTMEGYNGGMTTTKKPKAATPATIAKNVANPLDGIVTRAIEKGWRVSTRSRGKVLVLDNRGTGENH